MLFNSIEFLLFIVLFFVCWPRVKTHLQARWIYLTGASFFFYGWADWRYLILLVLSGLLDFCIGLGIPRFPKHRRILLLLSMAGNLGLLFSFKYLGFFLENLNALFRFSGLSISVAPISLFLPVGISFYTFQSMSYTIDIYRGQLQPTRNIWHFFAYLSMFPQLVAGPIVRAAHLLPQLERYSEPSPLQKWNGLRLIIYGYFKKVVIADHFSVAVDSAFRNTHPTGDSLYWWFILILFAFQIYCDFSGYTDIARGLGKWMGYDFSPNFQHPYIASSIREFWQRWHISLSTWFRDYVYIPLGGGKRGVFYSLIAMWITMLISGFWHGAAWNFLIWGALHAFYLTLERLTQWPKHLSHWRGGRLLSTGIVFILVLIAWIFFRAHSTPQALEILEILLRFDFSSGETFVKLYLFELGLLGLISIRHALFFFHLERSRWWRHRFIQKLQPLFLACLITACVFLRGPGKAFIYFQF